MGPCQIGPESFPSADIFFMHLPLALNQDHIHALLNFILYTTRAATTRFRLTAPTAAGATAARSTTFSAAAATAFATTTFVRLFFYRDLNSDAAFQHHVNRVFRDIDCYDLAGTAGGSEDSSDLRHQLLGLDVVIILI